MAQEIKQVEAGRESDVRVAVEVMGWQVRMGEVGNSFVFWGGHFPKSTECVRVSDFTAKELPRFLTDASADYSVHKHVCATWTSSRITQYVEELSKLWQPRANQNGHTLSPDSVFLLRYYEVGDYSRAALEVGG